MDLKKGIARHRSEKKRERGEKSGHCEKEMRGKRRKRLAVGIEQKRTRATCRQLM